MKTESNRGSADRGTGARHSDERPTSERRPGDDLSTAHDQPDMVGSGAGAGDLTTSSERERLSDDGRSPNSGMSAEQASGSSIDGKEHAPLFPSEDTERFRSQWTEIQTNFVDEPRRSVEQANDLVAEVTERLTSAFAKNRNDLERQWGAGDEVSTENLRRTLQRYRSFFERLLSM